jgi:hypothetical protein
MTPGARQISSAPTATITAGQTIASPGQGPAARTNSRPLQTSRPAPSAILRPPRGRFAEWEDIAAHHLSRVRDHGHG